MTGLATAILVYFLARECWSAWQARDKGIFWTVINGTIAGALLIPLWAVWS